MEKLTEIIPENIPLWAKAAIDNGTFFKEAIFRAECYQKEIESAFGNTENLSGDEARRLLAIATIENLRLAKAIEQGGEHD